MTIESCDIDKSNRIISRRCIYDDQVSSITFDDDAVCNYRRQLEQVTEDYGTDSEKVEATFAAIVDEIKAAGKGKKYDYIIGVSGGTSSSHMVYLAKKCGLRPLAVHYDNTSNTAISTQNIRKVLAALDIDLYTHVVDNKEADDISRSFFYAGVAEIEASTDLALAETMYRAAAKFGIKYVLEGQSFITEGISPVGRNYFDGRYIRSIHKRFGTRPLKTYPLMTISRFLWWSCFAQIQKIRPFWFIDYSREKARAFLEKEYDWKYYGGHHLENRVTALFHSIYAPQKVHSDFCNNTLSALVRNKKMTRKEAWRLYHVPQEIEAELLRYFQKRLGLCDEEYKKVMAAPPKSWYEFPTYKKHFERLRLLFFILAKRNLVPMSFYLKYCFPSETNK